MSAPAPAAAPAHDEVPGADLPLRALAALAQEVGLAAAAGAESPAARGRVEALLAELRRAWPDLDARGRQLLGGLVTGLVARRPATGAAVADAPSAPPSLGDALVRLGVRRLRPGQDRAIAAGLAGRDALVVMATGSGKSLCYQAPAACLPGLTVVVSPLIALMDDQLGGLRRAGIPAAALHSGLDDDALRGALAGARDGTLRLLYVAPERLHSPAFRAAMDRAPVDLLVVDEAHCVSEWGHEFRPDYRRVDALRRALSPRSTMALTATATPQVRDDIVRRLGLRDPLHVGGGFDRPNIVFDAMWVEGRGSGARRRGALLAALEGAGGGKAIVYCGTRRASEETAEALRAAGHAAVAYHAGRADRAAAQEAFTSGDARVVAATNAFGMGVNVPDVRLVVHIALPDSLEQLYQEAGRAGRDGEPSRHVIVAGPSDEVTIRRRIAAARVDAASVEELLGSLAARADPDGGFTIGREQLDERTAFRLTMAERVGAVRVDGALGGGRRGTLIAARLGPGEREELAGLVGAEMRRRHRALDDAVAYVRGETCRRAVLLGHFGDDAEPAPEERCCDVCAPPADLLPAAVEAATPSAPAADPAGGLDADQRRTFEVLRVWRGGVAKELGWPAFRVASNRTLAGIAAAAPGDEDRLLAVRGVGPWLVETHAAAILAIVRDEA